MCHNMILDSSIECLFNHNEQIGCNLVPLADFLSNKKRFGRLFVEVESCLFPFKSLFYHIYKF